MILVSHPTGNQFVRQLLLALAETSLLDRFVTTISWRSKSRINAFLSDNIRIELERRSYPGIPEERVVTTPVRESARLLFRRLGLAERNAFSVLRIARSLDHVAANLIRQRKPSAVYAYEGTALQSFREAHRQSAICFYELPSAYWHYELELLREEAELKPEYADTIRKLKDTKEHLDQKDEEIASADHVIVPSSHITRTLGRCIHPIKELHIVPYGMSEATRPIRVPGRLRGQKLRVLFVGALTQRKGIGYAIDALTRLGQRVEVTLIGARVGTSIPLDRALRNYRWIPTLPHHLVLEEMANSDVLLLPSLTEGFGLVLAEALSRGLPVITTRNSGGVELIRDGVEGFLIPIRSSEEIAAKLELLDCDRERLEVMSSAALKRARLLNWSRYRELLLTIIKTALSSGVEINSNNVEDVRSSATL